MFTHLLISILAASLMSAPVIRPASQNAEHLFSFEKGVNWRPGNEPHGTLVRATEQFHDGSASARLDYQLPGSPNKNYMVFTTRKVLKGRPNAISAWVYGDGSNHFLNVWIQDAQKETRMFTFGRVSHQGWKNMVALFDTSKPWPNVHISGPDNGVLDYPVAFTGIVLDNPGVVSSGRIYIDEFKALTGASAPAAEPAQAAVVPAAAPAAQPPPPPPAAPACAGPPRIESFTASATTIELGQSITLRWGAVTNASRAEIDQGIGGISTPGQVVVTPNASTTYRLTATGCGGTATQDLAISVTGVQRLDIRGRVLLRDHDTFSADEIASFDVFEQVKFTRESPEGALIWQRCVGDEVRAEMRLTTRLQPDGSIRVFGSMLLFEGSSCANATLKRSDYIDITVTTAQPIQRSIRLEYDGNEAFFDVWFTYTAFAPLPR